jgi:hypothetical protein
MTSGILVARLRRGLVMNFFYVHHKDSIRWHYRCFDRLRLNGLIQPFQQPERVVGFFNSYPVSRNTLRGIAEESQQWLKGWTQKRKVPVLDAPMAAAMTSSTHTSEALAPMQSWSSSRHANPRAS